MADKAQIDAHEAREKILSAASQLFARQGYENTTLSQVAREAKVSKALIFWHFDSKEALYRSALRRTLEPYFINVDSLEGLEAREQLGLLIDRFFAFTQENVYSVRFFLTLTLRGEEQAEDEGLSRVIALYRAFEGSIAEILDRGQRQGVFRADASPTREAAFIMATLGGILIQRFLSTPESGEPEALLNHLKTTLFQRLLVDSGAAIHAGRLD
ncbi:TetR/AcrR family transcriptional regulator [Candidatus Binatia bacterium]|nr:TetR/AcrR family transcriptional regulator [Candidatus Binatia bacterium]